MAGKSLANPGHDSAAGDGIAKALSILQESHLLRAPVSYSAKSPPLNIRILTSAMPKTANIINMYVSFIATNVDRYRTTDQRDLFPQNACLFLQNLACTKPD